MGDVGPKGAARVDRATIAREVIARLAAAAHVDAKDVSEHDALELDLGFDADGKRALAADYDAVIHAHHGEPVTMDDAGDLEQVRDAVDLVFHHCGGHDAGGDA